MSKTGILTYFSDNIGLYEMAATNVSITKEAALEIAMPYIEEYATANGRKIEATNATLNYVRDLNGSRGDSTLIYPQWCVSALFDSSTKEVYGFDVFVWADTGLVDSAHAQGNYRQPDDLANLVYSLIWATVIISVIATILCVGKKWFVSKGIIPKLMIV